MLEVRTYFVFGQYEQNVQVWVSIFWPKTIQNFQFLFLCNIALSLALFKVLPFAKMPVLFLSAELSVWKIIDSTIHGCWRLEHILCLVNMNKMFKFGFPFFGQKQYKIFSFYFCVTSRFLWHSSKCCHLQKCLCCCFSQN